MPHEWTTEQDKSYSGSIPWRCANCGHEVYDFSKPSPDHEIIFSKKAPGDTHLSCDEITVRKIHEEWPFEQTGSAPVERGRGTVVLG